MGLKCTKCGIERSYADAQIEDLNRTCLPDKTDEEIQKHLEAYGTMPSGEEHEWEEE